MIRRLVRHLLEAAIASKEAAGKNLALYRKETGLYVTYILYDPVALEEDLLSLPKASFISHGGADPMRVIYGFLEVKPHSGECWNATEITGSAAQKGYGPLMYELAMSDFDSLMSDRRSTSTSARKVWQFYNKRQDVKATPLDNKANPKTPPKIDDCTFVEDNDVDYLNNVYSGAGDSGGKHLLIKNHEQSEVRIAERIGRQISDIRRVLEMLSNEFFSLRYEGELG